MDYENKGFPILDDKNNFLEFKRNSMPVILRKYPTLYKWISQVKSSSNIKNIDVKDMPIDPGPLPEYPEHGTKKDKSNWTNLFSIWKIKDDQYKKHLENVHSFIGLVLSSIKGDADQRIRNNSKFQKIISNFLFLNLWKLVLSIYEPKGYSKAMDEVQCMKDIYCLSMIEGEDIKLYRNKFDKYVEQMTELKLEIPDHNLAVIFINGLSSDYTNLKENIRANNKLISFQKAKDYIAQWEVPKLLKPVNDSKNQVYNIVEEEEVKNNKLNNKIKCHRCLKYGHFAKDCEAPKPF